MKRVLVMVGALACLVFAMQGAASPIRVSLDYFANPNHIPLYVALDKGYFAEEGIDVDIFVPANPSDPVKLAASGAIELALTPQINYLMARSEGLPLMAVGALIDHPLGGLVALRDRGIDTLNDLAGKRIGYSLEPLEPVLWQTVFGCAGMDSSGFQLVNVGFNTVTALVTGSVDAIGAFRNYEVFQLQDLGYDPVFFPEEDYCVPLTYELILVASPDFVSSQADVGRGFLRALVRGIDWTLQHPDDALLLFFERFPDLDDDLNRRSFDATLPLYSGGADLGDAEAWQTLQTYLADGGLMKQVLPVEDLYTDALLPVEGKE